MEEGISEDRWNESETEVEVSFLNGMLSKISMQTAEQENAGSRTSKEDENSRTEIATPLISDEDKTKKPPLLALATFSEQQVEAK